MKKLLFLAMLALSMCCVSADDTVTTENPNTVDILDILGYSYWKFTVPNDKSLKSLQCEIFSYAKDKNGAWVKTLVSRSVYNPGKESKAVPKRFTVGFYQKGNDIRLKLETASFVIKVEGKHGIDKMDTNASPNLSLDENGDIILKWKALAAATDVPKKELLQSYLALHISIADGL